LPCYREMGSSGSRLLCSFGQEDILAQKTQGEHPEPTYPSLPEASSQALEKPHPSFWPLEGSRIDDLMGVAIIPLGNWRSWLLSDSSASFLRETPFKAREDKGSRDVRDQREEHSTREVKE